MEGAERGDHMKAFGHRGNNSKSDLNVKQEPDIIAAPIPLAVPVLAIPPSVPQAAQQKVEVTETSVCLCSCLFSCAR